MQTNHDENQQFVVPIAGAAVSALGHAVEAALAIITGKQQWQRWGRSKVGHSGKLPIDYISLDGSSSNQTVYCLFPSYRISSADTSAWRPITHPKLSS